MESILINGSTNPGRRRTENQDAFVICRLWSDDKALATVIDGVGGYAGGEKAAAIAKDCIGQYMQVPSGDTLTMLREAVIFANNRIVEERKKDPLFSEMCCVLTALVADAFAQCIYFVHVGDTRLYRYRGGKVQKLTHDHSFVGIREDAGEISEQEAMAHPHRNRILREVGSALHRLDDEDFMDYGKETFVPGDQLLLCSDGLTDMISSVQLAAVLDLNLPLTDKTEKLIELANAAGGHDNITVALLHYPGSDGIPVNTDVVIAESKVIETVAGKTNYQKNRPWKETTLVSILLLLILIAGAGWYLIKPKKILLPATSNLISTQAADSIQTDSSHLKMAGRSVNTAVEGPVETGKTDTLRISSTQNFADIKKHTDSSGKTLVLLPEKHINLHFSAISITVRSGRPGDTLLISNLRLIGFENGIDIHLPVALKADNLVFENITTPFRYLLKPGEKPAPVLFINTPKQ